MDKLLTTTATKVKFIKRRREVGHTKLQDSHFPSIRKYITEEGGRVNRNTGSPNRRGGQVGWLIAPQEALKRQEGMLAARRFARGNENTKYDLWGTQ